MSDTVPQLPFVDSSEVKGSCNVGVDVYQTNPLEKGFKAFSSGVGVRSR